MTQVFIQRNLMFLFSFLLFYLCKALLSILFAKITQKFLEILSIVPSAL